MMWLMAGRLDAEADRSDAREGVASLSARAADGDRDALSALLRAHAQDVYRLCHHLVGAGDGRDAAQEALERIVRQIGRYDERRGEFRSWALSVSRNVCLDRLRRRKLERATFADGDEARARNPGPDPERQAAWRAQAGRLAHALEALPETMRTAVVLYHVHGRTYEQIADTLEVPMGTVMTWLHRGRRRLREALDVEGASA